MKYWRGYMDWTIDSHWKCETCGEYQGLEWGLIHAQCRCNNCHTQYFMRADDEQKTILTIPKCLLKDEYQEPARKAWIKYHVPIDSLSDSQWDEFLKEEICHVSP